MGIHLLTKIDTKQATTLLKRDYGFSSKIIASRRARRVTLRVDTLTEDLRITIPYKTPYNILKRFVEKNREWIRFQLSKSKPKIFVNIGSCLPIFGVSRLLLVDQNLNEDFLLYNDKLILSGQKACVNTQVKMLLKSLAKEYFENECKYYAEKLGVSYNKIVVKDTKSRWGSCSANGNMMFSWRLVLAPKLVSSYVSAHEVAHLVCLDHSSKFWKIVGRICPEYPQHRAWLRKNGMDLHRFVF